MNSNRKFGGGERVAYEESNAAFYVQSDGNHPTDTLGGTAAGGIEKPVIDAPGAIASPSHSNIPKSASSNAIDYMAGKISETTSYTKVLLI